MIFIVKNKITKKKVLVIGIVSLLLASCGGGSSSSGPTNLPIKKTPSYWEEIKPVMLPEPEKEEVSKPVVLPEPEKEETPKPVVLPEPEKEEIPKPVVLPESKKNINENELSIEAVLKKQKEISTEIPKDTKISNGSTQKIAILD
ncbi:MAG: hypothetical protein IJG31_05385, partial [Fusobacterium sp.]|nr:hypothetical protein [Fusobacterium sp.]